MKKSICIDFDGVIHSYKSGWQGATVIPDAIMPGAKEAINELAKSFTIVIHTTRANTEEGYEATARWLDNRGVKWDTIEGKPIAIAYIDDRAIRHNTWYGTMNELFDKEPNEIENQGDYVEKMQSICGMV
jgi:5'(3')-deoxyribonucleotidase